MFIKKIAQVKQVEISEFLRDFDKYVTAITTYKPHDLQVINVDAVEYLTVTTLGADDASIVASNIGKYITYLETSGKRESLASFVSLIQQPQYEKASKFIFQNCRNVAMTLFKYTASIR